MTGDLLHSVLATCDERGAAPALTGPDGRTLSYATLGSQIRATAGALRENGMRAGDRVLFSVRPSPACVVLALGIVVAGGTVVFADPGAGPELFAARFALAAPTWAAAESLLYAASRPVLRPIARRRGLLLPDYAGLAVRHVFSGRWLPGVPRGALSARRLTAHADRTIRPSGDDGAEALVVFTSGTTGAPRAVVHTRRSLGSALSVLAAACRLGPDDVVHTDQLMLGLPALVAGALWTMPPFGFRPATDPARYATGLSGATHTVVTPAELSTVLDLLAAGRLRLPSSPRHLLVGGAPVLAPLLRRARTTLPNTRIHALYGMTEILPVALISAEEKLAYSGEGDLVGRPLPGVAARIGAEGALMLRGAHLCRGYLGEPPLVEHITGDLARIDDAGRIILVGRSTDMIIRGRTNIYPGLYEPTIAGLPGVGTATLLGVSDEIGDERVVLVLTPADARDDAGVPRVLDAHPLATQVRAALPDLIDASAIPDEVVVVSHLPRQGRGRKPDRSALRALLAGPGPR
jgi:acyl-CoA synthetase (AMP-forming)/AMP-acid ligase II